MLGGDVLWRYPWMVGGRCKGWTGICLELPVRPSGSLWRACRRFRWRMLLPAPVWASTLCLAWAWTHSRTKETCVGKEYGNQFISNSDGVNQDGGDDIQRYTVQCCHLTGAHEVQPRLQPWRGFPQRGSEVPRRLCGDSSMSPGRNRSSFWRKSVFSCCGVDGPFDALPVGNVKK